MLNMLLPTMLPTAMSRSPRSAAITDVATSGIPVPAATTVSAITSSLTPSEAASLRRAANQPARAEDEQYEAGADQGELYEQGTPAGAMEVTVRRLAPPASRCGFATR